MERKIIVGKNFGFRCSRTRTLILIFLWIGTSAFSQMDQTFLFDRFSYVKGLGGRSINCMVEDTLGFIWLGSQDGLLRFDGYDIKIYKNKLRDKNSLTDNNVRALAKDSNGNIWIATQGGGLDQFNLRTEKFAHYKNDPTNSNTISSNAAWSVFVDHNDVVWIGTFSDGLNAFSPKENKITRFTSIKEPIMAITESPDGKIWFGGGGLNMIDPKVGSIKQFKLLDKNNDNISSNIRFIISDKKSNIWIATDNNGIFVLDPVNEKFTAVDMGNAAAGQVYALLNNGEKVLAGTNGGVLSIFNNQIENVYQNNPSNPLTLSSNSVRSIFSDSHGGIWIGCEGGGLNRILERKNFRTFRHSSNESSSLSFNLIRSISDDSQGRIWVGTQGGGLNVYYPEQNQFKIAGIGAKGDFKLSSDQVSAIYEESSEIRWIGTWGGGLNKVNLSNNEVIVYRHREGDDNSLPDDRIQIIYLDRKGRFWIGTENGLAEFDRKTETWVQHRHDPNNSNSIIGNNIQGQAFVESDDGSLWIGTWFGLNQLNADGKTFKRFKSDTTSTFSLSNDHVISLHADKLGNLWIGTFGGGLNQLEINTGKIYQYTENEGLCNNTIFGIKEDAAGNLWMSTSNGLSRFDPKSKTFRNYDAAEGLQSNEFYWGGAHKARDGSLLFGGINGLNWFKPEEIQDNDKIPTVLISDFQVFNKAVPIGENSILSESINFTEGIKIRYDQAVLNFEFVALNYNYPEKNQYAYRLDNFDKDWTYPGQRRTATYTNLDPGEYTFRVKASNNDNVWNDKGVALKILITPPFWRTVWFYMLIIFGAGGLVYMFVVFRVRGIKRDKEELKKSLESSLKQAREELEQQKQSVEDEKNRNLERHWTDESLSKFGEILSTSKNDVKELCGKVLNALIRHLEIPGGVFYIHNQNTNVLEVKAVYGIENPTNVSSGENLVGACYEQGEPNIFNNLPEGYCKISSGLGASQPRSLVLLPIKFEELCLGVIELASFQPLAQYRIQFIQLLAERLATTINATILSQNTQHLLNETRAQAEDLKLREEELKQNLEELQAINEDRDRKTRELENQIEEYKKKLNEANS